MSGESVAIVRRTGEGKPSIKISGVDIARVARRRFGHASPSSPQNCAAFTGTVREKLDPEGLRDESELVRAVCASLFAKDFVIPQAAVDHQITGAGANQSTGRLQLLAIARCLLLGLDVVILDEVSAAADEDAEALVHSTVMEQFRGKVDCSYLASSGSRCRFTQRLFSFSPARL